MPNSQESLTPAPAAVSPTRHKLLRLLGKRLRQLAWATLGLAVVVALAMTFWWFTILRGLPDIGDPFDVAALRELTIPDDQNAFTFLRRAHEALTPLPELPRAVKNAAPTVDWSQADPKLRAWVEANRAALELFQQGADQSDGIWQRADMPYWQRCRDGWWRYRIFHGGLMWLALLEGGRHAESGDPAGAWDCYRAVLRMTTHLRRRGSLTLRYHANTIHTQLRQRLATWAADPRTTVPQLRRALDEALASQTSPEWDALSLKLEYLEMMRYLEQQSHSANYQAIEEHLIYHLGPIEVPSDLSIYVFAGRRFLMREPERSRRVLRLLFANWLAHVEVPEPRQSRPAVRASFLIEKRITTLPLYPVSPQAPAGARVLSPLDLASWLVTINDARPWLGGFLWPSVRNQERRGYRDLVVLLATELYRRERGGLPRTEEALVGTYLQVLPDDGSAELDDGTTPTVTDSHVAAAAQPR
ncbi:MAG TPA: hypothetical protein VFF52_12350 [Isosphaeraceae bacterium]|nr:hypothetical protein [Isosphaeraceae bacterium]